MSKLSYRIEDRINSHHLGGGLLIILGVLAILFSYLFSKAVIYVVGTVILLSGLFQGFVYFTAPEGKRALLAKSLLLISLGFLCIFSPLFGLKILTAILILFFLFAAITNFMLAKSIRTQKGAYMAILTGTLSLILDVLLLMGWSQTSQFFVGIFLGVIFVMDGLLFLMVGEEMRVHVETLPKG